VNTCEVERTKRVTTKNFSGKVLSRKTVTEKCGTPLFGALERHTGVCGSCASGWTHRGNKPTEAGKSLIRDVIYRVFKSSSLEKL
jgi:hypothetical protein